MSDIEAEPGEVVHDLGEVRETGWGPAPRAGRPEGEPASSEREGKR